MFVNSTVGDVHRAGASLLPSIVALASIPVPFPAPAQMSPDITFLPGIAPSLTVTSVPGMAPNSFAGLSDGLPISSSTQSAPARSAPAQSAPSISSPPRSPVNIDWESPEGRRYWSERKRFKEALPRYEVKMSKSVEQQKGIQWLSRAAKSSFESWIGGLMEPWGLSPSAESACVCFTCPADWIYLEAGEIAGNLHQGNSPVSSRMLA